MRRANGKSKAEIAVSDHLDRAESAYTRGDREAGETHLAVAREIARANHPKKWTFDAISRIAWLKSMGPSMRSNGKRRNPRTAEEFDQGVESAIDSLFISDSKHLRRPREAAKGAYRLYARGSRKLDRLVKEGTSAASRRVAMAHPAALALHEKQEAALARVNGKKRKTVRRKISTKRRNSSIVRRNHHLKTGDWCFIIGTQGYQYPKHPQIGQIMATKSPDWYRVHFMGREKVSGWIAGSKLGKLTVKQAAFYIDSGMRNIAQFKPHRKHSPEEAWLMKEGIGGRMGHGRKYLPGMRSNPKRMKYGDWVKLSGTYEVGIVLAARPPDSYHVHWQGYSNSTWIDGSKLTPITEKQGMDLASVAVELDKLRGPKYRPNPKRKNSGAYVSKRMNPWRAALIAEVREDYARGAITAGERSDLIREVNRAESRAEASRVLASHRRSRG